MELPIPKSEKPQMTVPTLPNLPMLPSLFSSILPTPVPQLTYKPGVLPLVEGFIHNWKLRQMERASEREANISENKFRQTRAQFAQIEEIFLSGLRYSLATQKIFHELDMLTIAKETAQANLVTIQLQNLHAQIEAQKSQLELQQMMKELGVKPHTENGDQG